MEGRNTVSPATTVVHITLTSPSADFNDGSWLVSHTTYATP